MSERSISSAHAPGHEDGLAQAPAPGDSLSRVPEHAHAPASAPGHDHGSASEPEHDHDHGSASAPEHDHGSASAPDCDEGLAQAREQVLERLRLDKRFVLAAHESPDGDALGSLVGMHGLLDALGKDTVMFVAPGDLPLPYEYRDFFHLEGVIQKPPADVAERTVVFLDCGNIDRNSAPALQRGRHVLNIDHHHDNTRFGTVDYVVPGASCTAEIVWDLYDGLGVGASMPIARALYIGLITDTGRFMYENTGPRAHVMAAELIDAGVDAQEVYRRLYEEMPEARSLASALERMQRFDSGELTVAALSAADLRKLEAQDSFAEGIVDHLRAVQGTKVAALVRELGSGRRGGQHKVSLRASDDDVDVWRSPAARPEVGTGARRASPRRSSSVS